ncbi:MAG: ketoacyl-ACP synthase III [Ignavibacteriae bacterium]|nr:ketoacyl-ACP synthase III [Ignavibacteriota bacterium]
MEEKIYSVIAGTGCYIPEKIVHNDDFLNNTFYENKDTKIEIQNSEIIRKFEKITNIAERRYVEDNLVSSDIASVAAERALESSGIDRETLDYVIVAHNFGDVKSDNRKTDIVPSLASRVKHRLGIKNPFAVAYDIIFGCPGWLQGIIQANYFIKSGDAKRALVIGAETLSRVSDPFDRDSMIYSDGAGATILEGRKSNEPIGIMSHETRTDAADFAYLLGMDKSFNPKDATDQLYLKMNGRKLYEYAISTVPQLVKNCIEKAKLSLDKISKVLIHQANEKMDEAILQRVFRLFESKEVPPHVMPMIINKLGNSSVATLPILLDLILKDNLINHTINPGDNLVFASVGAGMNINAFTYRAV